VYAGSLGTTQPMFGNAQMLGHNTMPGRGRQKSQAQIDRRRERNRILARRTRLRKKFFFEGLQKDVNDLQRENTILKDLVKKKFSPEAAEQLLSECNAMESLPKAVHDAVFENSDLDGQDFNLVRSIQRSQQCFIITDPSLQDNPIVYASDDFLNLTGYDREEVLGRNCRFLQGTETSAQKVEQVRKAVALGEDVSVTMINYTADGNAFWNKLFIAALRDSNNNIVNFIGVIVKVAAPEPDDPEAGKLLPGQQSSSVNGDADMGDDDDEDDDDDAAQMFC
jgi:PAS domain S-box-containing protein